LGEREGECGAVGHTRILERLESFCPVAPEGRSVFPVDILTIGAHCIC
jgi:hypothetical protein